MVAQQTLYTKTCGQPTHGHDGAFSLRLLPCASHRNSLEPLMDASSADSCVWLRLSGTHLVFICQYLDRPPLHGGIMYLAVYPGPLAAGVADKMVEFT